MKICFIASCESIHVKRWVNYFAERDYEIHLICRFTFIPEERGYHKKVILHVLQWKVPKKLGLFKVFNLPFWILQIREILKKIQPDILSAHYIELNGYLAAITGFHPFVLITMGSDLLIVPEKDRFHRLFTKFTLKKSDQIFAASADIKRKIQQNYQINPEVVHYAPLGVDTTIFSPAQKNNNRLPRGVLTIISNRGFAPVYDYETLVRGFSIALKEFPSLHLILIGQGMQKNIQDLVNNLGIHNFVSFKNTVPHSMMSTELKGAEIFVSTSISDGTPISLLEAMATELPCICTNIGGVPEFIDDGQNGILIPTRAPEILAKKILLLAQNDELRKSLGRAARNTVLERGDWYTLMSHVEKNYEDLIITHKKTENVLSDR